MWCDPRIEPNAYSERKLRPPVDPTRPSDWSSQVSMPTGSLCAERNVIGSALAADLSLLRRDIKAVAVLGMTLPGKGTDAASIASAAPPPAVGTGDGGGGGPVVGSGFGPGLLPVVRPVVSGFASSTTSVYGSSLPSPSRTIASPLDTPVMRPSPRLKGAAGGSGPSGGHGFGEPAAATAAVGLDPRSAGKGAWGAGAPGKSGGTLGAAGAGEEEKRLEGVREVGRALRRRCFCSLRAAGRRWVVLVGISPWFRLSGGFAVNMASPAGPRGWEFLSRPVGRDFPRTGNSWGQGRVQGSNSLSVAYGPAGFTDPLLSERVASETLRCSTLPRSFSSSVVG